MAVNARVAASALLALAAFAAPLIPWVPCSGTNDAGSAAFRSVAYRTGALVCHQRSDRSFASCERQWPVCGRCSGLYLGAGAVAWLQLVVGRRVRLSGRQRRWRVALVVAAIPTAALWLLEASGFASVSSVARFVLALPLGIAGGAWLGAVARGDLR